MKKVVLSLMLLSISASAQGTGPTPAPLARRIQFGATLAAVPDSLRARGTPDGALVLGVIGGSPAAAADIHAGDIIVRIDGDSVHSVADALAALHPIVAGATVPIGFVRNGAVVARTFVARERQRETSTNFMIEYRSVDARGGRHRVLVTRPNDTRRHPAVLLIGGIGCYSIDAPAGEMAYRDLAYHLTRRGYVTVRVEKLGIGDSDGGACFATDFASELDGYRQALIAMKSYESVDSAAIFIFGHSIGGIEAPLLAGEHEGVPRVRGVAVLSTVGIAWYEYELANLRRQLRLQHLAPDSLETSMRLKTTCGFALLVQKESRDEILAHDPTCARYIAYPAADVYMQAVADYAPAVVWKQVTAPALLMHGSSDFVTSRDEHIELTEAINQMHPGAAMYADIPELDHYLAHEASETASLKDPTIGLSRPYDRAALEPVLDRWLDSIARIHI
jgi:pimeloyl-ACP methyl ester carboxylesterase